LQKARESSHTTTKSAAVLKVRRMLKLVQIGLIEDDEALLDRIARMLTKLIEARSRRGAVT
jgi:hypothetical protein